MTDITKEQKDKYLNAETPNLCPECYSDQVVGGDVSIVGKKAFQKCICQDCEIEWEDTYTLSDVTFC